MTGQVSQNRGVNSGRSKRGTDRERKIGGAFHLPNSKEEERTFRLKNQDSGTQVEKFGEQGEIMVS